MSGGSVRLDRSSGHALHLARAKIDGRAREDVAAWRPPTAHCEVEALLAAVSEAMAALHERHYKRPPGTTKTQLMGDDLLACVLGGVYTDVEKTLIEIEARPIVRENRSAFQISMERPVHRDRGTAHRAPRRALHLQPQRRA